MNPTPGVFGRTPVDDGGPRSLQSQGFRLLAAFGQTTTSGGERRIKREVRAMRAGATFGSSVIVRRYPYIITTVRSLRWRLQQG